MTTSTDTGLVERLRVERAYGATLDEMCDNARKSPLYKLGDMVLVWANEGDLNIPTFEADTIEAQAARIAELEGALEEIGDVAPVGSDAHILARKALGHGSGRG